MARKSSRRKSGTGRRIYMDELSGAFSRRGYAAASPGVAAGAKDCGIPGFTKSSLALRAQASSLERPSNPPLDHARVGFVLPPLPARRLTASLLRSRIAAACLRGNTSRQFANAVTKKLQNAWWTYNCSYIDIFVDGGVRNIFVPHRWSRQLHLQIAEKELFKLPTRDELKKTLRK